jgi:tetratricopeptide (TPR) repeat protein
MLGRAMRASAAARPLLLGIAGALAGCDVLNHRRERLARAEEALKLEDDPNDKAFILYNMALVFTSNGDHNKAMELYNEALELNTRMPQVFNNMAVIHHHLGSIAEEQGDQDEADRRFDLAADFWTKAIRLAPNNYIEAQNWLKTTGRGTVDVYF